jgi:hypothetical protein
MLSARYVRDPNVLRKEGMVIHVCGVTKTQFDKSPGKSEQVGRPILKLS